MKTTFDLPAQFTVSTAYYGEHHDFDQDDLEALENYLDQFDYQEGFTLLCAVLKAVERHAPYIVEPVNGESDLTIDFKYD